MFSNFLYLLVALVIYTTSELFETDKILYSNILLPNLLLGVFFIFTCRLSFKKLKKTVSQNSHITNTDHLINVYISRLSVFALMIFATNIYGFKVNFLLADIKLFDFIPSFKAIVFLGLFVFYLIIIWNSVYDVQKQFFPGQLSKKNFIMSNVAFSLPALLPWFFLSLLADILGLLPWQPLRRLLDTSAGELGYIALFLVAISVFGPVLIKKLWNCKPLESGPSRTRIENICKKTQLKYSDILKWDLFGGTMITAGVMGIVGRFRYILVTPALVNSLSGDELDAVILHEIGHVQKHHMLFYLFFFAGFIACNFVFFEPVMLVLYIIEPVYKVFEFIGIGKNTAHPILISAILIGSFVLYFRYVFGFFMRNFERQADLHVYKFTHDASALISTFYKIASFSRQSIEKPNWHHYSLGQRVRFLEKCQVAPALIQNHHSKVKKIITGYFVLVLVVFSIGYSINYGMAKDVFGNFIAENILFQQLEIDPENSDLYTVVGDYYFSRKNYAKAIDAYKNVLKINPENVHALNNLSWLFSTCTKLEYRNKTKALEYARKALKIKREAFILDTYAQALFEANDVKNAVRVAKEALSLSKDKKEYYEDQLKRFENALNP